MWVENALKYMKFNDVRLVKRLGVILNIFSVQLETSIPKACKSRSEAKSIYRFLSNDEASAAGIRSGFYRITAERLRAQPVTLFLSDATNIVYSSRQNLKGIGVLRNFKARGLNLHTTLAVTPDKVVLGIVNQVCWGRKDEDYGKRSERSKKPIQEKESYRWIESLQAAQASLNDDNRGIFIGDRGADVYELFIESRESNMDLLIRSAHDRTLSDGSTKIFQQLLTEDAVGTMTVEVERSGKRKARTATLELRFKNITLTAPGSKKKHGFSDVNLTLVSAIETSEGVAEENKIYWKLLTTLPIQSLQDAIYAVKTYAIRWVIERYHYTLKQGCSVEKLQLEEAGRIDKAIAIYSIIACRIMALTYIVRVEPEKPCTIALSDDEWKALYCYSKKTTIVPIHPPTIYQAVRMIAQMGGFLGRKGDGEPGLKTIWLGLRDLNHAVQMYSIFTKDVGNG